MLIINACNVGYFLIYLFVSSFYSDFDYTMTDFLSVKKHASIFTSLVAFAYVLNTEIF